MCSVVSVVSASGAVVAAGTSPDVADVPGAGSVEVDSELTPAGEPQTNGNSGNGSDDDAAVTLADGGTYFVGQVLIRDEGVAADETLDLSRSGQFTGVAFSDSQGTVRIDTSGMAVGQYSLSAENGTNVVSFRLVRHTVDVRFESASVRSTGSDTEATLTVQSNRRSAVYYLTARVDGERVDADTLQTVFGGTGETLTGEVLRIEGTNAESYALNFSGVRAGEFTLTTNVPDTDATDSATITVDGGGQGSALFAPRVVQGTAGDVVTIGVVFERTDRVRIGVGSEALTYDVTMDVVDGDGDGEVVVRWDTSLAGTGDERAAFEADDADDSVTNVSRSTRQLSRSLEAEPYPLSVSVDGRETDVGIVSLQQPDAVRLCGHGGGTLVDLYHAHADRVPSWAESVVTDETIHLIVNGDRGGDFVVVTDQDGSVSTFRRGTPDDATVAVETDCETVRTVVDAQNPADAVAAEYDSGQITVRGTTFPRSIVIEVSELVFGIGRSLGLF